jgi:hypothetical protein
MRYLSFISILLFFSCQNESAENQLVVSAEQIALRAAPGLKGAETSILHKGDKLIELGEVSHFESPITFGNTPMRTPWLKVQTADNKQGWIFAGAVQPQKATDDWLLQKRLDCYFGHAFASRVNHWKAGLEALPSEADWAASYRNAISMRDSLVQVLKFRAEPEGRPDYAWLANVMPGFVFQRGLDGGPPELYTDYRFWLQKAAKSSGTADDAFLETCIQLFPHDSIESIFPVWKFPMSTQESASQLGTGAHAKVLQAVDNTLAHSRLFEPELMQIKDAVLEDIQDKSARFWQDTPLIMKDLDALIANPPKCLSAVELSALATRRAMFEDVAGNGIKVNLRSGEF